MTNNIPEPSLEEPEPRFVAECDGDDCCESIYEGDDYFEIDGNNYCSVCGQEYLEFLYKRKAAN